MPLSTRLQAEVKVLMTPSAAPAWCTLARSRYRPSPAHKPCINSLNSVLRHIQNCYVLNPIDHLESLLVLLLQRQLVLAAGARPGAGHRHLHIQIFFILIKYFFLFSPAPETPSCCHGRNCALGPASPLPPHPGQCLHSSVNDMVM